MSQANLSQSLPTNFSVPGGESILEHQMDSLMNAMDHMCVVEPQLEPIPVDPFSQAVKRSDPVYLANQPSYPPQILQDQQQIAQQQEYLEQQQAWLNHQQYLEQQRLVQQQMEAELHALSLQQQQQQVPQPPQVHHINFNVSFKCDATRGKILKRADLIPLQECPM